MTLARFLGSILSLPLLFVSLASGQEVKVAESSTAAPPCYCLYVRKSSMARAPLAKNWNSIWRKRAIA